MKSIVITLITVFFFFDCSISQTLTQSVKGKVLDQITQEEIIGASIVLTNSNPLKGTITGLDGTFILERVPIGRQSFEISMLGYETHLVQELLITSGKEVVLEIQLKEKILTMNEVVVVYQNDKAKAINSMSIVSSRQFTVEETQRYAGGLNDPARLVSSFAGVATPSISSNGISVRGNSPSGLLWRVEGVEIPSPNHFADLTIAGAGLMSVLSSQLMSNSDFFTGAFPAEYGNATSGVFDINLRTGNASKNEYTVQAGLLGVDFATEGPFKKGGDASYLLNYRYSTLALIGSVLPSDAGILKYQDLSFKLNYPTKQSGTFSFWSLAAYDAINMDAQDSTDWKTKADQENSETSMYLFASGLNHKIALQSDAVLNSAIAFSGNGLWFKENYINQSLQEFPQSKAEKNTYKLTLQSQLTSYLSNSHTNQTGFYLNNLGYKLNINDAQTTTAIPENLVNESGQSFLFQFYTQSKVTLSPRFTFNAGVHSQYFQLNNELTLEPRAALDYAFNSSTSISAAYGLHSKVESLPTYFIKDELGNQPNQSLKLMKSHHFVLSFNTKLSEYLRFSIETYYQLLNNVPVAKDSYVSTVNTQNTLFFNHVLSSDGTGKNYGVDVTLERYLSNGFYYQLTASVFESKYSTPDGVERNTRFNKNYVGNALIGKEWHVGTDKNNIISANFRINYLGGNRLEAIDAAKSIANQDIIYGETGNELSYSNKLPDMPIVSVTLSYRKNKPTYSSVWSLQLLNVLQTQDFETDIFNTKAQTIEQKFTQILVPNLSYKIEF